MQALAYKETIDEKKDTTNRRSRRTDSRIKIKTRNRAGILARVLILVIVFLFSMLYLLECINGLNYQQKSINYSAQLDQLDKQCEEVDAKIALLLSPSRLEDQARKMGMVHPERYKFLDLSKNRLSYYSD